MGNCQKLDVEPQSGSGSPFLRINNYMWNKDYLGLFDYDTDQLQKKGIKVSGSTIIGKNGQSFLLMNCHRSKLPQDKVQNALFQLVFKESQYRILPITYQKEKFTIQKLIWLVVASLPHRYHILKQKDVLKLGKQKVRIRQIVDYDMRSPPLPDQQIKLSKTTYENLLYDPKDGKDKVKEEKSENGDSEKVCRICLDAGDYQNPLIAPCKCSGSVRYVHLNCLRSWLGKRLNTHKTRYCISINWQPLSCEMCRTPFRYNIFMDNRKFYTVEIPKPPKPYIVIELIYKNSTSKGSMFHFISFAEKKKIYLGRKKDIDVRVSQDISISRSHASIQYDEEKKTFILRDNESKFGTLVQVKKGIVLKPELNGVSFQIGAEVFEFEVIGSPNTVEGHQKYMIEEESQDEDIEENSEEESESQSLENVPSIIDHNH